MKNNLTYIRTKFVYITSLFALFILLSSCNEKEFLNEVPLDFYSPENSFVNYGNFEAAVLNLYNRARTDFYFDDNARKFPALAWSGTELAYTHKDLGVKPNWSSLLLPTNTSIVYATLWQPAYRMIYDTNVIIERSNSEISELTDTQKKLVVAEASFFRAFAYNMLANLYGGVPIVLEEVTTPKRDFVRATRNEVYEQCAKDLKFAAENLPDIDKVDDSRINKLTAYHVLSQVYISLGKWQEAITAASVVIDHPATDLMTQRFGTRINDPGDVYWDLFRQGNQNRSKGNKESIWVLQYEFNVPGGANGFNKERALVPRLWQAKITNKNGKVFPLIPYPNTFYYGRGSGFIRPSYYFYETVWQKSGYTLDIRNSQFNIVRDFIVNNPSSDYNGKWVIKDKVPIALKSSDDTTRNFFPVIAKASDPGKHPKELWLPDQTVPGSLTNDAQLTYRDQYAIRLSETYLLRAEAYLGKNDKVNAAADINIVRDRAKAPKIDASLVDLDYILDERIRELYFEEHRLLTLGRLDKIVDRTKKLNPWVGDTYSSFNNLFPIPYDEIERNIEATLEQNPGYQIIMWQNKYLGLAIPIVLALSLTTCKTREKENGCYFGNGLHNGWADQSSIVLWTKLTKTTEMNTSGQKFITPTAEKVQKLNKAADPKQKNKAQKPDGFKLDQMEGACPGTPGEVMLVYAPLLNSDKVVEIPWTPVDPDKNFTLQWKLGNLSAGTIYKVKMYARQNASSSVSDSLKGSFKTPPAPEVGQNINFCIVTCHDYPRRDDSIRGHKIYNVMLGMLPDFLVHTGDVEYYDKPDPFALTEELMRFKWDRIFTLPYQRTFYNQVTTYFMKDDHDLLCNDASPGMTYGNVSYNRGMEIFDKEQFPTGDKPFKTVRWGKDLQIWIMEGRNFRSINDMKDGPEKTIWGKEQKDWLFSTVSQSDATFKLIITPTPILGPDRTNKGDNHANLEFKTEGDEIRTFINKFDNVFICNGDRHWQYVTHYEGTNLWEFSCGAGSDSHAGGWPPELKKPEHRFLRVKGGFLKGSVSTKENQPTLKFEHYDVDGNVVHTENFTQKL